MSKRILVTGASGFVGGSVLNFAPADWEVHACSRSTLSGAPKNVIHHALDLCNKEETAALFDTVRPEVVLHIAAIANIDYSETNTDEAMAINTECTGRLAQLAQETGARFVFCSTDNVFDGAAGNYDEIFPVSPINFYGRTKVAAEVLIHEVHANAAIARVALVIGLPVMGTGNSFLIKMEENLRNGTAIEIPENETRSPIDVITLGKSLIELAGNDYHGVINLAGSTALNRYDMAKQIATKLGYSTELVKPINSNALTGRAPRPNDVSLNNEFAREVLKTPFPELDEALDIIFRAKK